MIRNIFQLRSVGLIFLLFVVGWLMSCVERSELSAKVENYSGPYLGQSSPGDTAQLFAPGFISTALYTRDLTMTPDGDEIYFCVSAMGYNLIFFTKQVNDVWSTPEPAPFIRDFNSMHYEPHITADGVRLLFLSDKNSAGDANEDIWAVDRIGDGWGEPYNLGEPVNSDAREFFPSTTKNGTLYFTRSEGASRIHNIYRSKFVHGEYQEPEKLGPKVNCGSNRFNAFIDPDERFIIVPALGMDDSFGGVDYYIVFRNENDEWSDPVNLGNKVNSASNQEYSASLSPDGAYLFFMSSEKEEVDFDGEKNTVYRTLQDAVTGMKNGSANIYWIETDFIDKLAIGAFN